MVSGGTFNIRNTIVTGNFIDVYGNFTSQGHNLITNPNSGNGGFTGPGDQVGVVAGLLDIAQNGGPTWTHALQSNSTAINAGGAYAPAYDQRYLLRDGASDIGAYEYGALSRRALKITSITHPANGHLILQGLGVANSAHTVQVSPDLTSGFSLSRHRHERCGRAQCNSTTRERSGQTSAFIV